MQTSNEALIAQLPAMVGTAYFDADIVLEVAKAMQTMQTDTDSDNSDSEAGSHSSGLVSPSGSDSDSAATKPQGRRQTRKKKKTIPPTDKSSDDEDEAERVDEKHTKKKSTKKTSPAVSPKKGAKKKKKAAKPKSDGSSSDGGSPRVSPRSALHPAAVASGVVNTIREKAKKGIGMITAKTRGEFTDEGYIHPPPHCITSLTTGRGLLLTTVLPLTDLLLHGDRYAQSESTDVTGLGMPHTSPCPPQPPPADRT